MVRFPEGVYTDVRHEDIHETSIRIEDGTLDEYRVRSYRAAFVRVYDGERWYYEALTDLDRLQDTVDRLAALATPRADVHATPVVAVLEANQGRYLTFAADDVALVPGDDKRRLVDDCAAKLAGTPQFKSWRASYEERRERKRFLSSKGADLEFDSQRCGLALGGTMVADDGRQHRDGFGHAVLRFADLADVGERVDVWLARALDYLDRAVPVKPGPYPVVLSPEAAGVFAHECFGHKSEADFMVGDESARREWALGTRIGADVLTIVDDGEQPSSGFTPFDDEGTKARVVKLIDRGVLQGRLHSASTAACLGEAPTGNARACEFMFEPIPRMTTTYIGAGTMTKDELFAQVQDGIYVECINHGSGMSTFTLAPRRAYRVVDGKLAEPVKVSVVTGQVFQALRDVQAVSDTVVISSFPSGGCGKMEQMPLPVGFGGPYVLVGRLDVR